MDFITDVKKILEDFAPLSLQESYDNSGLITGNPAQVVTGALVCIDCTEEVVDEAINKKCNLIISHHPVLFSPLKKLTGSNYVERTLIKAIKNDIAIYAMHTNLDSVKGGVNTRIADKLELQNQHILRPSRGDLRKLVTYCPTDQSDKVREALFKAGAGNIGNYDRCSFNSEGYGTFRGNEHSHPQVGKKNKEHREKETRLELIFQAHQEKSVLMTLFESHPYEEIAYDVYKLENTNNQVGIGIVGELSKEISLSVFFEKIKKTFNVQLIRHSGEIKRKVKRIAVCGGSGSFLIPDAIASGADVFVTADLKYHQFFDAEDHLVLADIGHFESEQFTIELIEQLLKENFSTFATYFSSVKTNPIKYF
jgi:dinuclear metal center YbgI/SA1388 family protein